MADPDYMTTALAPHIEGLIRTAKQVLPNLHCDRCGKRRHPDDVLKGYDDKASGKRAEIQAAIKALDAAKEQLSAIIPNEDENNG